MKNNALPYRPCVGMMLINAQGQIFAAKRIDMPSNAWQMPQGGIDEGENAKQALFRELFEETGLAQEKVKLIAKSEDWLRYDLPEELIGKIWKGCYRGQRQKWFALRFLGDDDDINIETEHQEFSEWQWMNSQDILASIVPFKQKIYRQVFSDFAQFIQG